MTWLPHFPVARMRIARPTHDLERAQRFYCDGLGLSYLGGFEAHDGYSGIMIGLPDWEYHLEFTLRSAHKLPPVDPDNLLVFYFHEREAIGRMVVKLGALGFFPVPPANPYWEDKGVTIEDPDGWRVVLVEAP